LRFFRALRLLFFRPLSSDLKIQERIFHRLGRGMHVSLREKVQWNDFGSGMSDRRRKRSGTGWQDGQTHN